MISDPIDKRPYQDASLDEKPREACGIFAISEHPDVARITYFGLYALQHRGQESAGIAVANDQMIQSHRGMGLVPDVFDAAHLEQLAGHNAIGHVRYSTTGSSIPSVSPPLSVRFRSSVIRPVRFG